MKITVPVPFRIKGIQKGHRNPSSVVVKSFEMFEIKELSDLEAPLAITDLNVAYRSMSEPITETRWYENSNWALEPNFTEFNPTEFSDSMSQGSGVARCMKWNEATKEDLLSRRNFEDLHEEFKGHKINDLGHIQNVEVFDKKNFRQIVETDYEARVAFYQQICDELAIVDGKLYSKCEVPVISHFGIFVIIDFGTSRTLDIASNLNRMGVFSLHNLDILEEHLQANDQRSLQDMGVKIPTILIPEAADFPDEAYSLLATARFITDETLGKHLLHMTQEQGISWFKLRSAFMNAVDEQTEVSFEQTAERLRNFITAFDGVPLLKSNQGVEYDLNGKIDDGISAIQRWDLKKIDLNADFNF